MRRANAAALLAGSICAVVAGQSPPWPVPANKALDCAIRDAALNFSSTIQPWRDNSDVADALQLKSLCSNFVATGRGSGAPLAKMSTDVAPCPRTVNSYYVDAADGSDSFPGSNTQPFRSIGRAISACRQSGSGPCTIVLADSAPFVLLEALQLGTQDSNLSIVAYPGDSPIISGAMSLGASLSWQPFDVSNTTGRNIWRSSVNGLATPPQQLFVHGVRMTRARWPNSQFPETDLVPVGYSNASSWLPPNAPVFPAVIDPQPSVTRPFDVFFPNWTWATNGTCTNAFAPPAGYWCHQNSAGGSTYAVPSGFMFNAVDFSPRASAWAKPSTGIVHVFHGEYWGNWQFQITNVTAENSSGTIIFGEGGWQEARGAPNGGALFVENIFEELDAPGEWFYDEEGGYLYFWPNATVPGVPPPSDGSITVSQVDTLFAIQGDSAGAPATGITIGPGITFTGTQPTFMSHRFTAPSGGDWSFANVGAIIAANTSALQITGCTMTRLGGNGLLLRGRNEGALISNNTFSLLGDSAIVTAGWPVGVADLADVGAPTGTVIAGNAFKELGVFVKQAGALYSALSANTTFTNNIAFNLPRAAVNINDGAHGGHLLESNLFFNAVRETQDHGAYNSWDRQPMRQTYNRSSFVPLPTVARRNFIINNFYGIHSLDHDDGSNNFLDESNVVVYAGIKNYLGFNKTARANLIVSPDFAGPVQQTCSKQPTSTQGVPLPCPFYFPFCIRSLGQASWGSALADGYFDNTCLLTANGTGEAVYIYGQCDPQSPASNGATTFTANNTFYTVGSQWAFKCGHDVVNLPTVQKEGYDIGSVVRDAGSLTTLQIVQMIHAFLGVAFGDAT